jgi:hypothetical protein
LARRLLDGAAKTPREFAPEDPNYLLANPNFLQVNPNIFLRFLAGLSP